MEKLPYIKFLYFLEPKNGMPKEVDITDFIIDNFDTPNLEDLDSSYYDTDALTFLRKSDNHGYFSYYQDKLSPINEKWVYERAGKTIRYWFDTIKSGLNNPVYAKITDKGLQHLYEYRTNEILKITNTSIVDTNKALQRSITFQVIAGIITTAAIVLTAIIAVMAYYKPDSENLIQIRKAMQHQDSILQNIQQVQKERNTFLMKEAKKNSPKKP